jgi:hypothetical protein
LSTVPLTSTSLIAVIELVFRKLKNPGVDNFQWPFLFVLLVDAAKPPNIEPPDVKCLVFCQRRIVNFIVDPRLECFVEYTCSIGRQEENASIVIQNPQEHWKC